MSNVGTAVEDLYGTWSDKAKENGLTVVAEGSMAYGDNDGSMTFFAPLRIINPLTGSYVRVAAGTYVLGTWGALVVKLPPAVARGTTVTPTVLTWTDSDRDLYDRDTLILAVRMEDGEIWWRYGSPLELLGEIVEPPTPPTAIALARTMPLTPAMTVTPNIFGGGGIAPPVGPFTVLNGNFTAADFAEVAYIHTGVAVTIQKLHVKNCTDRGVGAMQWQPPNPNTIPGRTTVNDCIAEHITRNPPKTSNGTAEACFWFGNPVTASRIRAIDGGWMGIWTGNRCLATAGNPSIIQDFLVTGGNAVGVYIEHDTSFMTLRRGKIDQVGGTAVVIEWWYSGEYGGGVMHGSHDILFEDVEFKQEVFLDAGTYGCRFRRCIFNGNLRLPNKLMDPNDYNVATANRNYTQATHPNPNVVEANCVFNSGSIVYHGNNIGWSGQ